MGQVVEPVEAMVYIKNIHYPFPEHKVGTGVLYLKAEDGNLRRIQKKRAVIRVTGNRQEVVGIVGNSFALIPNELIKEMVEEVKSRHNLSVLKVNEDRRGNTLVIDLLSDKQREVDVGDVVQFGASVRNSIDGSTSLAVDAFSYRLRCRNGATAKVVDMSFSKRHIGNPKELLKEFEKALDIALLRTEKLAELYRKMVEVKMNDEIAERLVDLKFPLMYYDFTPIRIENRDGIIEYRVIDDNVTLWETFNHITWTINHRSKAGALTKSLMTQRLHKAIASII